MSFESLISFASHGPVTLGTQVAQRGEVVRNADYSSFEEEAKKLSGNTALCREAREGLERLYCQLMTAHGHIPWSDRAITDQIIETAVCRATRLFRYPETYSQIQQLAAERRLAVRNILTVPSGHCEAATLALIFPEARVDAIDISAEAIRLGRAGAYQTGEVLNVPDMYRRAFTPIAGGRQHQLDPSVHRRISYQQGSVFDAAFTHAARTYDLVMSNNLLIYLDKPECELLIQTLLKKVRPGVREQAGGILSMTRVDEGNVHTQLRRSGLSRIMPGLYVSGDVQSHAA